MDRWTIRGVLLTTLVYTLGCGSSGADSGPKPGPDAVVRQFLEAVRTGKDQEASGLLTTVARQKTAEKNLVVSPPGSNTASFAVGEFELESQVEAQVASTWSDIGDDGKPHADTIIWLLRNGTEGWRVYGMATKLFEDLPPLVLNFEDPDDMMQKQQFAEQELTRRMNAANPATAAPGGFTPPQGNAPPGPVGVLAPPETPVRSAATLPQADRVPTTERK